MKKTVKVLITVFTTLNLAAAIHAQTRMVPLNNPNASAGQGQAEIIINAETADKDIAVWVNGVLTAHVMPKTTEKIIVPNGRNVIEAADSTANRSGQWSTSTKRQITVDSNSNRVTIGLNTRYGSLLSLTIQGTVALAPAPTPPAVIPSQPAVIAQAPAVTTPAPSARTQTPITPVTPPSPVTGDQFQDSIEIAVYRAAWMLIENIPEHATVAVLNISTPDPGLAEIIIGDLEQHIWGTKKFTLVDRTNLDKVRAEAQFQLSGEVDDDSAVSIGKNAGASIVITGSVSESGTLRRLLVRALDVESTEVIARASERY